MARDPRPTRAHPSGRSVGAVAGDSAKTFVNVAAATNPAEAVMNLRRDNGSFERSLISLLLRYTLLSYTLRAQKGCRDTRAVLASSRSARLLHTREGTAAPSARIGAREPARGCATIP